MLNFIIWGVCVGGGDFVSVVYIHDMSFQIDGHKRTGR